MTFKTFKMLIPLAALVLLASCGYVKKEEKKVTQTPLPLSGIQSAGINLGAATQGSQKYVVVTCSSEAAVTNAQRSEELNALLLSTQKGSYVDFTILGIVITPAQMQQLLQTATQTLAQSRQDQCPSQYLASLAVN